MKHITKLLCMTLSIIMLLATTAMAADEADTQDNEPAAKMAALFQISGTAEKQDDGNLLVTNEDDQQTLIRMPEGTPIVDAVTGLPMTIDDIKDNDDVSAWMAPAMTMSIPPQANALVVIANIPEDGKIPMYYEIAGTDQTVTIAIYPPPERTDVTLPVSTGDTLTIPVTTQVTPWLTRQIVTVDDLVPGTQILVWTNDSGEIENILMLPYAYKASIGMMTLDQDSATAIMNDTATGDTKQIQCKRAEDDTLMLPIRTVAESAGYTVKWVAGKGAVVSDGDTEILSVLPGSDTAITPDDTYGLTTPCVIENGTTYLSLLDLIGLLNLYLYNI